VRQNSLCATRAAQTGCRKFEDEALALCGANARSPNRVPQALTHGWEIRAACESYEQIGCNAYSANASSYQSERSYPAFGIAPCAHACDGSLLGWRLHRRVQTHRALTCGNLFERSAASAQ
jgi:hypothetical protein